MSNHGIKLRVLVFHQEEIQRTAPYHCWEMIEKAYILFKFYWINSVQQGLKFLTDAYSFFPFSLTALLQLTWPSPPPWSMALLWWCRPFPLSPPAHRPRRHNHRTSVSAARRPRNCRCWGVRRPRCRSLQLLTRPTNSRRCPCSCLVVP